jgi:hypothetical protein
MAAQVLTNTKQALIAALVQKELKEKASLLPFLSDLSSLAIKGSKSISIPKLSSFTVQNRSFGAAATENSPLTDSVDTILLDKNKIVLFGYDSHDAQQSTIDYMMQAVMRASSAHGRQVNTDILAMWNSVASLNINGGTPADIDIDAILDMREHMLKSYVDMSTVALILSADQEKAMLKLPEFSRYDYRGIGPSPIINGTIGSVYGMPVIINQQVGAQQAYMVAKEGSAIAFQMAPAVAEQAEITYGTGGMKVAVDQLYGVGGLQIAENGAASGKSPLIAKLAD